jgi:signal peptidase I
MQPYNDSSMQTLGKLPRIAAIVAFVLSGFIALMGLLGPILILPLAIVPLFAGIGILRKRAWSAYGLGMYFLAQLLLVPIVLLRHAASTWKAQQITATVIESLFLGLLFIFSGRSLAASGASRGRVFPWIVVTALTTVPFFFIQTFEIPGASMEGTLLPGDRILAQTFPLTPPERGQMVIFLSPQDRGVDLVKRTIAIPGDHIRISRGVVILNGAALNEKYAMHRSGGVDFYPDDYPNESSLPGCEEGHEILAQRVVNGEIVVPAGEYFVIGDNRENSLDSRCWGFVASGDVVGKPLMIYDSIDQAGEETSSPVEHWFGRRRWARFFMVF